jgi:predicted esterase
MAGARHVPVPPAPNPLQLIEFALQTSIAPEKTLRTFEQRHLTVPRSARYAVMGSLEADLSEVWIVCHGHGQLATRFLSRFLPLERPDRLFVAPEALSRYYLSPPRAGPHPPNTPVGASWMTSEDRDREIQDYVTYLDLLHDEIFSVVDRAKVRLCVLGFSQGTATVARWVSRGKVDPDRVILCAGVLPPELDVAGAARLTRRSPLTIVLGRNDDFARPELIGAQAARLRDLRVPHSIIRFEGGHDITPEVLERLTQTATS